MLHLLSLLARQYHRKRSRNKEYRLFKDFTETIDQLPPAPQSSNKILLIRLDDIGDYVLFRNTLETWSRYAVEQKKALYLLGNEAWKTLLEAYDTKYFAQVIWLNKKQYFNDSNYRKSLWGNLRQQGFVLTICPARTRPILLDDACMLAANAARNIASNNSLTDNALNRMSDELYNSIFISHHSDRHEFLFNTDFVQKVTESATDERLSIDVEKRNEPPYILLFIGASAASKQWPVTHWNQLIVQLRQQFKCTILVAGGPAEVQMANEVAAGTDAQNIAGTKSLPEMVTLIGNAQLVISNDTMAAHIAAASGTNTIIITNGTNAHRFASYEQLGIDTVTPIYSKRYKRLLNKNATDAIMQFSGVRADIQSISVADVYDAAHNFMQQAKQQTTA